MSCSDVERDLVAYQLAALDGEARHAVETHLMACPACVGEYVALKRAFDESEDAPQPSDASRLRLRAAVARELGLDAEHRSRWERPFALAVAACAVLLAGAATRSLATSPGSPPHALSATR